MLHIIRTTLLVAGLSLLAGLGHSASARVLLNPASARHFAPGDLYPFNESLLNARFGAALAVGNFNGDSFDDLAIGMFGFSPDFGGTVLENCGAVMLLYGSGDGLGAPLSGSLIFSGSGGAGTCEEGEYFGLALAAGDFDGDGFDDLAASAPLASVGSTQGAGAVFVFQGSAFGLYANSTRWSQDLILAGTPELGDFFGYSLAAGDFNDDGEDDLAIGVPYDHVSGVAQGAVALLLGSNGGLSALGAQLWHQDTPGVGGVGESEDQFGFALAAGDLDNDGQDDLAIGAPYEDLGSINDAGTVTTLYGVAGGLGTVSGPATSALLTQDSLIPSVGSEPSEPHDRFGSALLIARINTIANGYLVIGAPGEDIGAHSNAGLVQMLGTSGVGPMSSVDSYSDPGPYNLVGWSLASGRISAVGGSIADDIVAGQPPVVGSQGQAGKVHLGIVPYGDPLVGDPPLFGLAPQEGMGFGAGLAVGNFDGRGPDELVIGSPAWQQCSPSCEVRVGLISIVDDTLFADGFD